jgi:hypothetical protein
MVVALTVHFQTTGGFGAPRRALGRVSARRRSQQLRSLPTFHGSPVDAPGVPLAIWLGAGRGGRRLD